MDPCCLRVSIGSAATSSCGYLRAPVQVGVVFTPSYRTRRVALSQGRVTVAGRYGSWELRMPVAAARELHQEAKGRNRFEWNAHGHVLDCGKASVRRGWPQAKFGSRRAEQGRIRARGRIAVFATAPDFTEPRAVADAGMVGEAAHGVRGGSLFLTGLQGTAEERRQQLFRAYAGLLKMARPHNFAPSFVLVLLGAWLAGGRAWRVLLVPRVVLVAALSGMVALTSMIANDVFDFRSGADKVNGPTKPLITGQVHADDAELTAGCLYGAVVLGCSCLEPLSLRFLVSASAVLTYIYTPFLKHVTLVKNVIVAAIIASSILAGGLAAGGYAGLQRTATMGAFLFCAIVCREIVMDVSDVEGDRVAGVMTVPARFGRRRGLFAALAALAAAHGTLLVGGLRSWRFASAATLVLAPLYAKLRSLLAARPSAAPPLEMLGKFVDESMLFIGAGLALLSVAL